MITDEVSRLMAIDFAVEHPGEAWVEFTPYGPMLATKGPVLTFLFRERVKRHLRNVAAAERAWNAPPNPREEQAP